ncbi:MAG: asparagine synthase B [Armatimonadetes bacterium]|nr:asparagine synthase B [Armatimonadota bacterium]
MCGIAGVWGAADEPLVRDMMNRLAHRGPDAEGLHHQGNAGTLGHRRLSIMDPAGGNQPIYNENRSAAIIANGEIYNFRALRSRLEARHRLYTTGDTEVVLHLFEELGPETAGRLDGMFAFAIADDDGLFLARDPIGIKPLYYGFDRANGRGKALYFASELKALAHQDIEVCEFPPGTCYHTGKGLMRYYTVPELPPRRLPREVYLRELRRTLENAIAKRLMSDVPLGAFLSGGLDSSIIAALARQHMEELHTFSVGIEGSQDIEAARRVARHIGSVHHEYLFTAREVLAKLPEIVYHLESFDQDLVRSAIPCYFCSRLAAEHVKVILTGEGADELFAGYTYYKDIHDPQALHRELRRSVTALHNINLQRVDRMTMAHGIEGRVPFLDTAMIELAGIIPPELKLCEDARGRRVEKWVLRQACEDLLPADIVWRDKQQFDEGSGTVDLLNRALSAALDSFRTPAYIRAHRHDRLRSAEEAFYHRLLADAFAGSRVVLDNVGRWAEREPAPGGAH